MNRWINEFWHYFTHPPVTTPPGIKKTAGKIPKLQTLDGDHKNHGGEEQNFGGERIKMVPIMIYLLNP